MKKIDDNHNEVMFLYNMLNEKEAALKDTIRDIEALKLSIKKMALVNDMSVAVAKKAEQAAAQKRAKEKIEPAADNAESKAKEEALVKEALSKESAPNEKTEKMVEMENDPVRRNRDASKDTNNKNEEILRLHREGNTNIEIAKKLGIGIGEVRLVIDLFRR